ncbi:MAG: hypothetical protein IPF98_19180 [Gemmatimonadetes bacterium]|nr:hypothetical protein [Gemmatimonadota bacterium]
MRADPAKAAAAAAALLDQSPDYLVLRRLPRLERYAEADDEPVKLALFVDVETTGLDARNDAIIQFCGVPFEFAPTTGRIHRVLPAIACYEDPGRPIPPFIVQKTGITDAMVAGTRLDEVAILDALGRAVLVIAHNAAFDRNFVERRLPPFAERHWACSMADVPWGDLGIDSPKLEFLLYKHARTFYEAHRADEDCYAGIHLLATALASGDLPMRLLLETARRPLWHFEATRAPFEQKDLLKGRGYRWNSAQSVWWRDVTEDQRAAEIEWLRSEVYQRADAEPSLERIDLKRRFVDRG